MMERLDNISLYGVGNNFHSNDEDSSRKEKSEKKTQLNRNQTKNKTKSKNAQSKELFCCFVVFFYYHTFRL